MHERSLVQSLIRQVESILAEQGSATATEIEVSIGPLSGVEPALVQSAFDQLAPTSRVAEAQLVIHPSELTATCRRCTEKFVVESFRFRCPACRSPKVQITSGDEFQLLTITVEEPCNS